MTEATKQATNTTAPDPLLDALRRSFDEMKPQKASDYAPKSLRELSDAAVAAPRAAGFATPATVAPKYIPLLPSAGMRHSGKLPVHLVPAEFNLLLTAVLEYGAQKYNPHNFEKGMDPDDLLRGAESHLMAMKAGALYDPESGLPHAGHAAWNMLTFAMQMMREPAMEEAFTRVVLNRRAGNLADVCREYAAKHGLSAEAASPEFNPTPWHDRVTMMRDMIKKPPTA